MPIDELIEFGLRVGFDTLLATGDGQTRTAAVLRAVMSGFGAAVVALILLAVLQGFEPTAWSVVGAGLLVAIGGYLVWRIVQELRLLRHWGEPTVMASDTGLVLTRQNRTLRWDEIASVTPEWRGTRNRVRIRLTNKAQDDVFIATGRPEALAAAILNVDALKGLAR